MTDIISITSVGGGSSRFDAIRQVREDGTAFWWGRDLMVEMGYPRWNEFKTPLSRAMSSAKNQGQSVPDLFRESTDKGTGGRPGMDFELNRFAAYLVSMNGDPNKHEVAAAQAYFAAVAEGYATGQLIHTADPMALFGITGNEHTPAERELAIMQAVMTKQAALVESEAKSERLEGTLDALRPAAAQWAALADDEGLVPRREVTHDLRRMHPDARITERQVNHMLRAKGMTRGHDGGAKASAKAVNSGWGKDVVTGIWGGKERTTFKLTPQGRALALKWGSDHIAKHGDLSQFNSPMSHNFAA